jgi:hypothetical protein
MTVRIHRWRLQRRRSFQTLSFLVLLAARLIDVFDPTLSLSLSLSESISIDGCVEIIPMADSF